VVEDSRQQEAEIKSLAEVVEAIEEDREAETSTQTSRETLTSQSSSPSGSPEDIIGSSSFNNTGSIEDDHEVLPVTSQSSSPSLAGSPEDIQVIASNNTGSIEDDHEVETSTRTSREISTSPLSPHWQRIYALLHNNNYNVGNIYETTIRNVGNNNSENRYYR
jgi:hypothetical protein